VLAFELAGGYGSGRDVPDEVDAALAFSSHASLLLWSTGQVSGCFAELVDIELQGRILGEEGR